MSWRVAALAGAVALAASVLLLVHAPGHSKPTHKAPARVGPVPRAVARTAAPAIPTQDGARAAALRAATASQQWLYLDDAHIAADVRAIATPQAAARLQAETVNEIGVARTSLADSTGRVWWIVRPLAWRVESAASEHTRVSVWTVTVLSAAGVAVPQADWMTVSVDLAWSGGRWLVDAIADEPGPTPAVGPRDKPWDAGALDQALAGFTRMDGPA